VHSPLLPKIVLVFLPLTALANDLSNRLTEQPTSGGWGPRQFSPGLSDDTYYLYRSPDRFKSTKVGILSIKQDRYVLNPPAPYPDSVPLRGMTLQQAESLWGSSKQTAEDLRVFELWAVWVIDKRNPTLYHLDTKFKSNILSAYRLRSAERSSEWIQVD
jgi:hypothetical protein